ncbi:unnamed protein product, partial [Vitis vinifera]
MITCIHGLQNLILSAIFHRYIGYRAASKRNSTPIINRKEYRAVISFVVNRIGDQLIEEAVFLKDVRPRIERLHRDLRAINCFLEAADAKQEEDPRVRNWVSDIRDVAYDAEDVVDMFILKAEALRRKIFVKRVFQKPRCLHNLGKKIDDVQTNLQDISKRREILGIKNIGEGTSTSTQMLQNLRRTTPPRKIEKLQENELGDFLHKRLKEKSCPPELKEFGERMVKKCAGLPLAIVVLGGLLSSKKQLPTEWEKVLKNLQAHFSSDKGVDAVLSLSYIDLPHNLRSCFLYLGLFPEDQIIPTRKLLLLWMAEGFIPQKDERRMEDTAEDYLNELISRNLVQVVTVSVNERATKCQIHDLVRDLCIKRAKEQTLFEIKKSVSSSFPSTKSHRQGIYFDLERYASTKHSTPYICSLFFFTLKGHWCRLQQLDFICKYFKLLRVLDLEGLFVEIPRAFGKLIHLRYLRNMENLQHLFISYERQDGKPLRIDNLRNLQTLSGIWFSDWQQNDTSKLPNLHKLKINVGFDLEVSQFSNSIAKHVNLRSFHYSFLDSDPRSIPSFVMNSWLHLSKLHMKGNIKQLPRAHEFSPNLTQLTLDRIILDYDPMAILEKLPKLLILRLRMISKLRQGVLQVSANGFPQLKILQLAKLKVFGEKMVKKCAGLPLAIVVLGGLLSSKKQLPTVWEQVLNKLQVPFSEGNGVDAILSLSFIDLPHNLKSCFLYLGLFPEDWVIPKRELLLLWITEGFIPQQDEQRMEDTAEDYLNELINRNLIQVVAVSINERSKKCRVHDLVRDLCIKKAKKQKLFEIQNNIVHVPSSCSSHPSTKCRRQGIHFGSGGINSFFSKLPTSLGNLRRWQTLDIGIVILEKPTVIQKMKNLRHLFLFYHSQDGKPLLIDTSPNSV